MTSISSTPAIIAGWPPTSPGLPRATARLTASRSPAALVELARGPDSSSSWPWSPTAGPAPARRHDLHDRAGGPRRRPARTAAPTGPRPPPARRLTQPLGDRVQGPAVPDPGQVAAPLRDRGRSEALPPEPAPAGQPSGEGYRPSSMAQAVNS